ncbi:MAG: hypothetical protein Q4C64_07200 [Erysipelotrichia bacterium]|nr:hypothetical protein [Erysipelotrichia bacterium]
MIEISNMNIVGWEAAIRGMRNPKNSWSRTDSYPAVDCKKCGKIERDGICKKKDRDCTGFECFYIGDNDLKLMTSLRNSGTDHRKFMRMIVVYLDINAPLYWWKEFDTYKVGTVANSCSTMHKIADKEFTIDDFSHEHLDGVSRDMFIQNDHDQPYFFCSFEDMLYIQVEALNKARNLYLETKDKDYWWQMIQLLPSSYNQRRTVMLNYEVLANIYKSRRNHKLDEWKDFCKWIESLPYSELITGDIK